MGPGLMGREREPPQQSRSILRTVIGCRPSPPRRCPLPTRVHRPSRPQALVLREDTSSEPAEHSEATMQERGVCFPARDEDEDEDGVEEAGDGEGV